MLLLALLAAAPFQFHVDASLFPNVVYHVGCLSGQTACTKTEIERFWHEDLHWTEADQRHLDAWSAAMNSLSARQPQPQPVPFLANFPGYYPNLVAVRSIMAAGLDSHSVADFRRRAAPLANPGEVRQLGDALDHFQSRLRPWWKAKGEPYAAPRRKQMQPLLSRSDIGILAGRIARFMESDVASRNFHVDLIPRDQPRSDAATGTAIGNHLLLELIDAGKPADVVPLMMHELTHQLYEMAPLPLHRKLIHDFAASAEPQAQALYTILNEGIATGVQLGVLRAAGQSDEDPYRHPFIPRIGRAVEAPVTAALDQGPTLFHGFLDSYLKASTAELKEEMASPRFVLLSSIVFNVGDLEGAGKAYYDSLPPMWSASPDDRDTFPETNIVFLIPYDKLDAIAENSGEIVPLSKQHLGFAFTTPRNTKGRVYVLAGRDDATVTEVVKRLAAMRTGSPDGLILSVD